MAPSNLQGLNVVRPVQPHNPLLSDSQDLLSAPPFPDLAAQLDLWTNLSFESDEPVTRNDDSGKHKRKSSSVEEEDDEYTHPKRGVAASDGHENVVTGTTLPTLNSDDSNSSHVPQGSNFDLNQFLSGFGIDPYALPAAQAGMASSVPSLAQLLSIHSQQSAAAYTPTSGTLTPINTQLQQPEAPSYPPAKRVRSRKTSVSTVDSPDTPYTATFDGEPNTTTPVTPAEDKRRRNTAASARFRMKKKEREAALEKKSKDLEGRVNELERECEGLRRENGWLKGLVVGVTGAQPPSSGTGKKRSRDESEAGSAESR